MKHSKLSSKAVSNFGLLLQDIRSYLGGNYVFYDECVVAITRAAARNEDASAWFEQMEKVVNGVREVEISHAGVLFLLQELIRGEAPLVNNMPPPPIPLRITPKAQPTMEPFPQFYEPQEYMPMLPWDFNFETPQTKEVPHVKNAPPKSSESPEDDLIFFSDPTFKSDVEKFFGVKASNNDITDYGDGTHHVPSNHMAYFNPDDLIPRYDPAADDLEVFKEVADVVKDNKPLDETDDYVDWQRISEMLELDSES